MDFIAFVLHPNLVINFQCFISEQIDGSQQRNREDKDEANKQGQGGVARG